MDGSSDLGRLETQQWDQLQDMASRFEAAWRDAETVDLTAYLPPVGSPLRHVALHELIKTDLEARWRRGQIIGVEAYLEKFPELGTAAVLPAPLIYEEYRVRHQHGDKPPLAGYERRFPRQFQELKRLVAAQPIPTAVGPIVSQGVDPRSIPPDHVMRIGGGYKLIKRIGSGGFAEVWQAETPNGFPVAIKRVLRPLDHAEAQLEYRALSEIKNLSHPYLLQTRDFDVLENRLYIVMDLADCTLSDRLQQCKQQGLQGIPLDELLRHIHEAAEALDYMHANKVHHRDIKPKNILLHQGHAKVADFGLARMVESQRLTVTGSGTAPYMAPEIWRRQVSASSDQYSLAVSYAELRLGRLPFAGTDMYSLMMDHLEGKANLDPLPEDEQKAIRKALSKEPTERFPSCLAFVEALEQALESMMPVDQPVGTSRRRRSTTQRALVPGLATDRTMVPGDTPPQAPPSDYENDTAPPTHPPGWRPQQPPPRASRGPSWVLLAVIAGVLMGLIAYKVLLPQLANFQLEAPEPLTLKAGRTAPMRIEVRREHLNGPISLSYAGDGVQISGVIPPGAESADITVVADRTAMLDQREVTLVADADGLQREIKFPLTVVPAYWQSNWTKAKDAEQFPDATGRRHYSAIEVERGGIRARFLLIPQDKDGNDGSNFPSFYIMENKVWNDFYKRFADAEPKKAGKTWEKGGVIVVPKPAAKSGKAGNKGQEFEEKPIGVGEGKEKYPALNMTAGEAHAFAVWLGGLLPTSEQWDKASGYYKVPRSRGPFVEPKGRKELPTGPDWQKGEMAVNRADLGPMPVGEATHDISVYKCRDMAGNGREWTRDVAAVDQRRFVPLPNPTSEDQVYSRGRRYAFIGAWMFKVVVAGVDPLKYLEPDPYTGFRVVIELAP